MAGWVFHLQKHGSERPGMDETNQQNDVIRPIWVTSKDLLENLVGD